MNRKIRGIFVTLILIIMSFTTVFGVTFMDMNGHWAKDVVYEMAERGIINGFEDGTYRPNQSVTREQFAKLLVETFNIKKENKNIKFEDIDDGRWSKEYIEKASKYLTSDTSDGKYYFRPAEATLREDVAVAVVMASGLEKEKPNYKLLDQFSDEDKISENLRKYIAIVVEHEIMKGKGGYFDPQGSLTRAEVAQLLFNIIEKQEEEDEKAVIEDIEKCEHKTKKEYVKKDATQHRVKTVCEKCGELIENKLENHKFENGKCACGYEKPIIYGDANNDEKVDSGDPVTILQYLEDKNIKIDMRAADVNLDGEITKLDAEIILKFLARLIEKLPHKCENHKEKLIQKTDEYHEVIKLCKCEQEIGKSNEAHKFENGKCICGAEVKEEEPILYGDINGDGKINTSDVGILNAIVKGTKVLEVSKEIVDVNLDGNIDDKDVSILNSYAKKLISELPHKCNFNNGTCVCGLNQN